MLQRAAAICFTAAQEQREVMESLAGIATVPSAVVPLGIEPQVFAPPPPPSVFLDRFPQARGRPIVLFLSRLDAKKGLDLLLEAFATVRQAVPDCLLVIAGEGNSDLVAGLQAQAEAAGISDQVLWTGFLSGDIKLSALGTATVFTLPSYSENFGIAVAEALAIGASCVLSDQIALTEDAAAAGAALEVPCQAPALAAALVRVLTEPATRVRLQANARRFARENFSMEAAGAALIKFYRTVV